MEVLFFLVPFVIALISSISININGSDNAYHLLMIAAIRNNDNRLINKMPFFVGNPRHSYPQLLHWIFSFFSEDQGLKYAKYTGVISHLLSGIFTYLFAGWTYTYLQSEVSLSYSEFLFWVAFVFSLAPLSYDLVNAKNVGFSARGIGLVLGQIVTYLLIMYIVEDNILYLLLGSVLSFLVYFSSAFAMQYILFLSILVTLTFLNPFLMIPSVGGILIFFLFFPRVASDYFKGQFVHKKIYALYLAKIFFSRYSIWRDLVYDFWKMLYRSFKGEESMFRTLQYITTNPVVNLMMGIPYILLLSVLVNGDYLSFIGVLVKFLCCSFILFFLTSFRWTKFLGEPERYVEFHLPIISILAVYIYRDDVSFLLIFGVFCFVFIVLRILLAKKLMGNLRSAVNKDDIDDIKAFISRKSKVADVCVFSNRSEYNKTLLSPHYQVFRHPLFEEKIGSFHFTDLHKKAYKYIENDQLIPIMKEFGVNYLVYLKDELNQAFISKLRGSKEVNLIKEYENLLFFEYTKQNS